MKARVWPWLCNPKLALVSRLILGSLFLFSGLGKLPEPAKFVEVVSSYHLLPETLAYPFGLVLPWVEVALGLLLLLGLFARGVAVMVVLLVFLFLLANGMAVYGQGESSADECGCFGDVVVMKTSDALIVDGVMLVLVVPLLLQKEKWLSLDAWLATWRGQSHSPGH